MLADVFADVSNTEQLSLVLRFVNHTGEIKEQFIEFLSCKDGVSGEVLSALILSNLQKKTWLGY